MASLEEEEEELRIPGFLATADARGSKVLWDVTRMCSSSRPEMVIQLEWQQFRL
jgi:hypothetical protein